MRIEVLEVSRLKWYLSIVCRCTCPIANTVSLANDGADTGLARKVVIMIFDGKCQMLKVWRLHSLRMQDSGTSMCLILLAILFALTKEITAELSSHKGVGSGHRIPRFSRNNLHYFVLFFSIKQHLTSASALCSGTSSLNTFHAMIVPSMVWITPPCDYRSAFF